jgi:hypothetical protein
MTPKTMKSAVEQTGTALLTLFNTHGESHVVGNVHSMNNRHGRLNMMWKLPNVSHISAFDRYMIHDQNRVFYTEVIVPVRLDDNLKRFDLEFDL